MLEKKGGSAKIKHDIFNIAPAPPPPPLSINNDQSLTYVIIQNLFLRSSLECARMSEVVFPTLGGILRGKKDRDDRRKSLKTTLKNTKP